MVKYMKGWWNTYRYINLKREKSEKEKKTVLKLPIYFHVSVCHGEIQRTRDVVTEVLLYSQKVVLNQEVA